MRYIDFSIIDQNDPDVIAWVKRAKQCNQELAKKNTHVERKEFMKSNSIWQAFKPILIKYYGEKCWYSECDLIGSFADVDHFRPKNKSTDEDKNVILQDGYWWLAYDYLNYRLSCNDSNRSFGNGGKNDIFPLKKGSVPARVGKKDDIPILLDPCVKSDSELIDCNEIGEIISLSTDKYDKMRVDTSKKIYNWDIFNPARKQIRSSCKATLETFELIYELAPDRMEGPISQICKLIDDRTPYSSFARRYIEFKIQGKPYESVILELLQTV